MTQNDTINMWYSISVKEHTHKFILPPFLFLLESLIERLGSYIFNSIVHKVDTEQWTVQGTNTQ